MTETNLVNSGATRSFNVSSMPLNTWVRFKQFAELNCGDNYGMAIDKLLTFYEEDFKYSIIFDELNRIKEKINSLEEILNGKEKNIDEDIIKTFGGIVGKEI